VINYTVNKLDLIKTFELLYSTKQYIPINDSKRILKVEDQVRNHSRPNFIRLCLKFQPIIKPTFFYQFKKIASHNLSGKIGIGRQGVSGTQINTVLGSLG